MSRNSIAIHCIVERIAAPGSVGTKETVITPSVSQTHPLSPSGANPSTANTSSTLTSTPSDPQLQSRASPSSGSRPSSTASCSSPSKTHNIMTSSSQSVSSSCSNSVIEQDSYAIISNSVMLSDLVRTALARLGYSPAESVGAKGKIKLNIIILLCILLFSKPFYLL
jgi:hypothetical protein